MQDGIPGQEEADRKISEEVNKEILAYEKQYPEYNWEALRDLCFSVVYTAKREWFTVGFHYAVELMEKDGGSTDNRNKLVYVKENEEGD